VIARGPIALLVVAGLLGCAGHATGARRTTPTAPAAGAQSGDAAALQAWVADLRAPDAEALGRVRALGVRVDASAGALSLTGERAPDDAVAGADAVLVRDAEAAVLVHTRCGNAYLLGVVARDRGWALQSRMALVEGAAPGRCRQTRVRAEGRAMRGAVAREVVVEWVSVAEEGDELPATRLGVFTLPPGGELVRLGDVEFGRVEEESGEVLEGTWEIDESLSLPRDLYVQLTPSRSGAAGREIVRRTYSVTEGSLRMVDEERVPLRPRATPTAQ